MYIPLLSFSQQRDGSAKRLSKPDSTSKSARFTAFIDDSVIDLQSEADSASTATVDQQRPGTAEPMESQSAADVQLKSLLRDEFIIR